MAKYSASDLRHRIRKLILQRVPDGGGGYTETYVDTVPPMERAAMVKPQSARERWFAGQTSSLERLLIVIRFEAGWNQSMKIAYETRTFDILAVIDVEERHEWLELDCEERFAG